MGLNKNYYKISNTRCQPREQQYDEKNNMIMWLCDELPQAAPKNLLLLK